MTAAVTLKPMSDWTTQERVDLDELSRAVYPPEDHATWSGRHFDWAGPDAGIQVTAPDRGLVSYTGVTVRDAGLDGRAVRIGGIGGIKTHPQARRQGFAALGVRRAIEAFHERLDIEFGLLVCDHELIPYYSRLGWVDFGGQMLTEQQGRTVPFTFNRVMVIDIMSPAPRTGTIGLRGPPW